MGHEKFTTLHRIPARADGSVTRQETTETDTEGSHAKGYLLAGPPAPFTASRSRRYAGVSQLARHRGRRAATGLSAADVARH